MPILSRQEIQETNFFWDMFPGSKIPILGLTDFSKIWVLHLVPGITFKKEYNVPNTESPGSDSIFISSHIIQESILTSKLGNTWCCYLGFSCVLFMVDFP